MPDLIINSYGTKAAMQKAKKEFEKQGYKCFAEIHVHENKYVGTMYKEYVLRAEKKEG